MSGDLLVVILVPEMKVAEIYIPVEAPKGPRFVL
jgi:hypothetical protein